MRISRVVRMALLAVAAISALSLPSTTEANTLDTNSEHNVATIGTITIDSSHETRVLGTSPRDDEEKDDVPTKKKTAAAKEEDEDEDEPTKPPPKKKSETTPKETTKKEPAKDTKETTTKDTKNTKESTKETKESIKEKPKESTKEKPKESTKETKEKPKESTKDAKDKEKAAREAKEAADDEKLIEAVIKDAEKEAKAEETPKKKKPADTRAPAPEKKKTDTKKESPKADEKPKKETKDKKKDKDEEDDADQTEDSKSVKEKKIKGNKKEGVIDGSSEGSAEIDKIDLRNNDGWVSVYDDPPLLVIKASLYAFISYNDTEVCDTFNMTMNAVEQKVEENGRFSYHVVAYINCTKNNEDETQGRFILNFIPEGKRLLLTECGHREEGEIVNWLRIEDEVPECMTPKERKEFLAQPMKHIHISNGTNSDVEAVQTDFLTRLEEFDPEEVAIFGAATVAFMAVLVVLIVFIIRKRKAQKDLERTIAGAKAEHAVEDDDLQIEAEEKATKERKGLMDSAKAKTDDPDMEEGSFVNSPAVRV